MTNPVDSTAGAPHHAAIFFDCDGVLNEEPGQHGTLVADEIKLLPGAGVAVRRAKAAGRLTVAVTNRPQVARGLVTFEELDRILDRLKALLAAEGGSLDRIYFCPHHPDASTHGGVAELKIRCECRKPGTLMLRRAFSELPINKSRSILIGDSLRDIGAARGVGIWAYGVRTGYGCRDRERYIRETGEPPVPDLMFEDVAEAIDFELGYGALAAPVIAAITKFRMDKARPIIVSICGRSCAGKTAIAHAVTRSLIDQGIDCLHVRLDDWTMPSTERGSGSSVEDRNRVTALPEILRALRAGQPVTASGYDPSSHGRGAEVVYDPAGQSVILLDGSFAAHASVRDLLDLTVFIDVPADRQRTRFVSFYRWKGLDQGVIDELWRDQSLQEWPGVDAQRQTADLVLVSDENR